VLRHIRLLIFDLDYTVFDCAQLKAMALRQGLIALADLIPQDMPLPGIEDAESGFLEHGPLWIRNLEIGLNEQNLADLERAYTLHESRLIDSGHGKLFPGVVETLTRYRKSEVTLALGADASRDYLISVMERYQLDGFFQAALCTQEFGMGAADEMLMEIMRLAEVNPSETLMLGTRTSTFQAARALDIQTVGCGWGLRRTAGLREADFQSNSLEELAAVLEQADSLARNNFE
jgi:phosphoglycolate phosphatase-like HAD superfamily hydrolase